MAHSRKWLIVLAALLSTLLVFHPTASSMQNTGSIRDYWPTTGWRGVQPELQGMNATLLQAFWHRMFSEDNVQGFLVIRNGYLLFEASAPGITANHLWRIYSCTKSVSAAALGLALADGYVVSVDDSVLDYFPDRVIQNPDPWKSSMSIWHLLTMSSGLERSDFGLGTKPDWVQYLLDSPMTHEPGEFWNYNGGCSHLLSAIISETTGASMGSLVHNRLFTPMGISVYEWGADPQGVTAGMAGLSLTLRDLAKIAYLYLNNGTWGTEQLIPTEWIVECIQPHFVFPYGEGYGYQWWIDIPISGYSMRGAGGMRVFVLPEEDLVLAFAASPYGSEEYYEYFNEYIYPAIIGSTMSLPAPTWEQGVLLLVGFSIMGVSVLVVFAVWKRKVH